MNDIELAKKYINKRNDALSRGIKFSMSFQSYKNIMKAKTCRLSGLPVDNTTRTIDRIDHTKGYEKGNVCCCHHAINQIKNTLEKPCKKLERKLYLKVLKKTVKHIEGMGK